MGVLASLTPESMLNFLGMSWILGLVDEGPSTQLPNFKAKKEFQLPNHRHLEFIGH
jgi:hypothetical protein